MVQYCNLPEIIIITNISVLSRKVPEHGGSHTNINDGK